MGKLLEPKFMKLFIFTALLSQTTQQAGAIITTHRQILGWRRNAIFDAAYGDFVRTALEKNPQFAIEDVSSMEVPEVDKKEVDGGIESV